MSFELSHISQSLAVMIASLVSLYVLALTKDNR
jgi:hypothetical protein